MPCYILSSPLSAELDHQERDELCEKSFKDCGLEFDNDVYAKIEQVPALQQTYSDAREIHHVSLHRQSLLLLEMVSNSRRPINQVDPES